MIRKFHMIAAIMATICISLFFTATSIIELVGSPQSIAQVKHLIVLPGLFFLVPAVAAVGATGFALSKSRQSRLVKSKKRRMPFIAANGLLVLVPAAIVLDQWASAGSLDMKFYLVQWVELTAGGTNLLLMGLNMRDGLRMTGRFSTKSEVYTESAN